MMTLEEYLAQDKKAPYFVKDINFDAKKESGIVFILESPHVEEIKAGKPLMGEAGKSISKILLNKTAPLGETSSELEIKIAIINVSNVPLQKIKERESNSNYNDVSKIKGFERFRNKLPNVNSRFFKLFDKKIRKYINKENLFVVCGEFACNYFFEVLNKNKINMKDFFNGQIKVIRLPHPSYHSWEKIIKYYDSIIELKKYFH